jgi:spermidine synthase
MDTSEPSAVLTPASRLLLPLLAFTEGAAVMIAELAGGRMLAPLYGSSLYVWGAVIGITLISLTLGYYLGGRLSSHRRREPLVYWLMLTAAMLITVMPITAQKLMTAWGDMDPVKAIPLLASIYLLPPLLLLGATTPLIIALLSSGTADAGKTSGTVYGISTLGGIAATFAAGFWLIPDFGLTRTALATGIGLAILPCLLLLSQRQLAALLYPALAAWAIWSPAQTAQRYPGVDFLYQSEGLLGQIKIVDIHFINHLDSSRVVDRVMFVNRTGQTWINRETAEPRWDYVRYLRSIASTLPPGSRVLLLGMGGGIVARTLQDLGHTVDSVELDARIPRIATDYFGLKPNGRVIVDDGRHYLRSTAQRYDLIIFDVFQAEIPPAHLLTVETFRELRRHLNPGGFVAVNYSGFLTGSVGIGARSIYKTLLAAGYQTRLIPTSSEESGRNNLYVATQDERDFSAPSVPLFVDGRFVSIASTFMDPKEIDLEQAMVLTDDRPVLEKLNLEAAALWRAAYYQNFTKPFLQMGIPLFD